MLGAELCHGDGLLRTRRRCGMLMGFQSPAAVSLNNLPITIMDFLLTHLRHQLTFLASIGTMLLGWHLLAPEQVDTVNAAGAELVKPVSIIVGSVGVFLGRLAIAWMSNMFSHGTGEKGNPPGWVGLLVLGLTVGSLIVSLPSCNPGFSSASLPPLKICGSYQGVEVCAESRGQKPESIGQKSEARIQSAK